METWIKMASELLRLHLRTKPLFDWLRPRPRTWSPFSLCLISTHSRFGSTTNCRLPSSGSFAGIAAVPSVPQPQCHRKLITNLREITPSGNCCGFVQINPHICKSWSFLQRFNQCFFTVCQLFSLQNCDRSFFFFLKIATANFFPSKLWPFIFLPSKLWPFFCPSRLRLLKSCLRHCSQRGFYKLKKFHLQFIMIFRNVLSLRASCSGKKSSVIGCVTVHMPS